MIRYATEVMATRRAAHPATLVWFARSEWKSDVAWLVAQAERSAARRRARRIRRSREATPRLRPPAQAADRRRLRRGWWTPSLPWPGLRRRVIHPVVSIRPLQPLGVFG